MHYCRNHSSLLNKAVEPHTQKNDKLSDELLKEVDTSYTHVLTFDQPGCKAADGQTEIMLQVHEDKHFQKQSVEAVYKDVDHMW